MGISHQWTTALNAHKKISKVPGTLKGRKQHKNKAWRRYRLSLLLILCPNVMAGGVSWNKRDGKSGDEHQWSRDPSVSGQRGTNSPCWPWPAPPGATPTAGPGAPSQEPQPVPTALPGHARAASDPGSPRRAHPEPPAVGWPPGVAPARPHPSGGAWCPGLGAASSRGAPAAAVPLAPDHLLHSTCYILL